MALLNGADGEVRAAEKRDQVLFRQLSLLPRAPRFRWGSWAGSSSLHRQPSVSFRIVSTCSVTTQLKLTEKNILTLKTRRSRTVLYSGMVLFRYVNNIVRTLLNFLPLSAMGSIHSQAGSYSRDRWNRHIFYAIITSSRNRTLFSWLLCSLGLHRPYSTSPPKMSSDSNAVWQCNIL